MDKGRLLIAGVLAGVFTCITAIMLLMMAEGCATVDLGNPRERRYDPNYGVEKEDILKHCNLHRGRWWNYYDRGSVYLAYGHHQEALSDFEMAITKRDRDRRDARKYGMHFIDYFPHRESGAAYYFQGELATDDDLKEQYYEDAIDELEISLRQEESARAKFYLNRARSALWQFTKKDTIPPTIRLKRPIYTNQRTVRFDVTVTDYQSQVGDIRIGKSVGDVWIRRPRLLVELARQKITRTAEVTLGPGEKYAVVAITASDLAGNESKPDMALIVLDTRAPTAGISVVRDKPLAGDLVAVSIEARDDFGLKQIEVGVDPTGKVECEGKPRYSGTVVGMPRGGELTIALVDNAGNTTVASIPVEVEEQQTQLPAASFSPTPWRLPLTRPLSESIRSRPLSRAYLLGLGNHLAQSPMIVHQAAGTQISSLAAGRRPTTVWGSVFKFKRYVMPAAGVPKETSGDTFTVEGTLWNPSGITSIKVQLNEQLEEVSVESTGKEYHVFSPSVSLTNVPIGETQIVKVEACRESHPVPHLTETLKVTRVEDVSREDDAIYGILLLPLSLSPESNLAPSKRSGWNASKLSEIYEHVFKEFESLLMGERCSTESQQRLGLEDDEPLKAFRMYHVSKVYGIADTESLNKLSEREGDVVRDLRSWRRSERRRGSNVIDPTGTDPNLIDLVVFGDVKVDNVNMGDKEDITITLRAVDVASDVYLRFPIRERDRVGVLTDTSYCEDNRHREDDRLREENRQIPVEILTQNAANRIPRLYADIEVDNDIIAGAKRTLRFGLGRSHRVFGHMKLWLYEKDALMNAKLTKVDCLDLDNFNSRSSWIKCGQEQLACHQPGCHHIVITK